MSSPESSTPTAESWTVGRLLTWTTDYLKRHGSSSARLDAEVLLAHVRGCKRIELYTAFNDEVPESERVQYRELIRQRAQGNPVAYLVGYREFYSLPFRVTSDVLIPRPETELVVENVIDVGRRLPAPLDIADVGTGSGILAICAARHLPQARVTALDVSPAALEVARHNAEQTGVVERIEFVLSDLFEGLPTEQRFDVIASNPPYVTEAEYAQLAPDVRDFEPKVALVSGPEGTETIARLLIQSATRLRPGGWLICELSPMICGRVRQLITESGSWKTPHIAKDLARLERVVIVQRTNYSTDD